MRFANLFSKKDANAPAQLNATTASSGLGTTVRQKDETYQQWGTRWGGQTNATPLALASSLQVVICQSKREQEKDIDLQNGIKKYIQNEIDKLINDRENEENNISAEEGKLRDCESNINEKAEELSKIKEDIFTGQNRHAKVNFIIGLSLVILISLYLFLFYSSTGFSAFYRTWDVNNASATAAMFDAQAWGDALHKGVEAFFFILLLPVLFMGLGYILHQVNVTAKKKWEKYLKGISLYGLTFIFDGLLAYKISNGIDSITRLTQLPPPPPFSLSAAIVDNNFWLVIFCGFVAYIIWGLVFGFTMDNYEALDYKKVKTDKLKEEISNLKNDKAVLKTNILGLQNKISTIKADIKKKESALPRTTRYDYNSIKQEMNNFFNGWIAYMKLVNKPQQEFDEAQKIFIDNSSFISGFNQN
jgi:peptidoglycan hydrolase CwlO-like protein